MLQTFLLLLFTVANLSAFSVHGCKLVCCFCSRLKTCLVHLFTVANLSAAFVTFQACLLVLFTVHTFLLFCSLLQLVCCLCSRLQTCLHLLYKVANLSASSFHQKYNCSCICSLLVNLSATVVHCLHCSLVIKLVGC